MGKFRAGGGVCTLPMSEVPNPLWNKVVSSDSNLYDRVWLIFDEGGFFGLFLKACHGDAGHNNSKSTVTNFAFAFLPTYVTRSFTPFPPFVRLIFARSLPFPGTLCSCLFHFA